MEAKEITIDEKGVNKPYVVTLKDRHAVRGDLVKIFIKTRDNSALENIDFYICSTALSGISCKQSIYKNASQDLNMGYPEFVVS